MSILKSLIFCFFIILESAGCQTRDEINAALVRGLNPLNEFVKDIQLDTCGMKILKRNERLLGISSLINGFDSIHIRLSYGCALDGPHPIIALTLISNKWKAEIIETEYYSSDHNLRRKGNCSEDSVDSASKSIRSVNPASGWQSFISKLFALQVLSLPSLEKIPGYRDIDGSVMDGCGIRVQVATKRIYRVYDYSNPVLFADKYPEAKKAVAIGTLLNTEFGLKKQWPLD